jgi:leucyl aminopeptidase
MNFTVKLAHPEKQRSDCILIAVSDPRRLSAAADKINQASNGYLSQVLKRGDIEGKFGQFLLLQNIPGVQAERIVLVGQGEQTLTEHLFRDLVARVAIFLSALPVGEVVSFLNEIIVYERDTAWKIQQTILAIQASQYRFDDFKSKKNNKPPKLNHIIFNVINKKEQLLAEKGCQQGIAIADGIKLTKDLANVPANVCNPTYLATQAKQFAKAHGKDRVSCAVLEEKDLRALGMGLILSVTAGSTTPAKLITLEYRGAKKSVKPIVLVGKGITFDTGGNSIKIPPFMIGMKYDMCGAATVFGVMQAAISLEMPINLIGVIPSCENMPGPNATRPEDIVTSMSGLTVEILNTDAEGRLILADALTYAERFQPAAVINIATLTGACNLALGPYASGLMANNEALASALLKAGQEIGDRAWQLPLWPEYHDALKSDFADLANVPVSDIGGRTIVAGSFLSKFTEKYPWAHLDVANTATSGGSKRGATGRPVALLTQYLLDTL